ncbi:MAG: hypothetical protein WBV91_13185 [Desulfobacterales bacterium]
MTSAYLFDSHALLAFFQKEAGAEIVARILNEALKQNTDTLISVMNLGEIIYLTKRRFGEEKNWRSWGASTSWAYGCFTCRIPWCIRLLSSRLNTQSPMPTALPWPVLLTIPLFW